MLNKRYAYIVVKYLKLKLASLKTFSALYSDVDYITCRAIPAGDSDLKPLRH